MVTAADERRHVPGPDTGWEEWWSFDLTTREGALGASVRLGLFPNRRVAWWWAELVGEGRRPVVVRDAQVPLPRQGRLEIRSEGLWGELTCEAPLEHWTVGMEAFGVALDHPADAWRGERGERVAVGLDLEWEKAGPLDEDGGIAGYRQPCTVHGEVLVGPETIGVEGAGWREHGWDGPEQRWAERWWSAEGWLDDGRRLHVGSGRGVMLAGDELQKVTAELHAGWDHHGLVEAASIRLAGGPGEPIERLTLQPLHHAPVLVTTSAGIARLDRFVCRYRTPAGVEGSGWAASNQPGC